MKKVAIVILAMTLLMVLFAVPVMATPKDSSPAWHTVPATDTYYTVTYDELTAKCLAAGLSGNPYPAPVTPIETIAFPIYTLHASEYYIFTITIGDEAYPGVSCTTYDLTVNMLTGDGQIIYQAPHYFGELGKMNHGFDGFTTVNLYGTSPIDPTVGYWTASWSLQGFGRFKGQTLVETQDSRIDPDTATGYCLMLGNKWYK